MFKITKTVCLKDVSPYGTMYYSRYVDMCFEARELLLFKILDNMLSMINGFEFVTMKASMEFRKPSYPTDELEIMVSLLELNTYSTTLLFSFYRRDRSLVAVGEQQFCLIYSGNSKKAEIPFWFSEKLKEIIQ